MLKSDNFSQSDQNSAVEHIKTPVEIAIELASKMRSHQIDPTTLYQSELQKIQSKVCDNQTADLSEKTQDLLITEEAKAFLNHFPDIFHDPKYAQAIILQLETFQSIEYVMFLHHLSQNDPNVLMTLINLCELAKKSERSQMPLLISQIMKAINVDFQLLPDYKEEVYQQLESINIYDNMYLVQLLVYKFREPLHKIVSMFQDNKVDYIKARILEEYFEKVQFGARPEYFFEQNTQALFLKIRKMPNDIRGQVLYRVHCLFEYFK